MNVQIFKKMMPVQWRIKKIMSMERQERDVCLRKLARELGCSFAAILTHEGDLKTEELIRRIQEADRSTREAYLWLIAVISAFASFISALAAWRAVLK